MMPPKNASALIDQLLISGGNFFTLLLCARLLPSDEMGKIGFIFAAYMGALLINVSLIYQHASSHAARYQDSTVYPTAIFRLQLLIAIGLALLFPLMFLALPALTGWHSSVAEMSWVMVFLLTQQLADYYRREKHLRNQPHASATMSAVVIICCLLLLMAVPFANAAEATAILVCSAAPAALTACWMQSGTKTMRSRPVMRVIKWHLSGTRYLAAAAPIGWLWSYLPLFFLGQLKGLAAVGAFTAARSLANAFNIFLELLETRIAVLAGMKYAQEPRSLTPFLNKVGLIGFGILGFLGGGIYLFRHELVALAYASRYPELGGILAILILAQLVTLWFRLEGIRLRTQQRQHAIFWGYVGGAIGIMASAPWLIGSWGLEGAAWSIVFGSITITLAQRLAAISR
jgi:O-antigen/teichoic acid export membrane protein